MSVIDTKREIMQVLEARLLAGVLQNIDNFNMLEEKTNKNVIFTVDDYKKFYEVCKILYNKQKYTNIDEFALSTFLNTLAIDEKRKQECMNIFYLIQQLNGSDIIDFEGVLEQYTIVSVPLRLYDKIARNGGLEEFIGKLTNFDNSEDLTTTIEGMISEICSVGTADSNFVETNLTQSINDDFIKNIRSGKRIDCVPFDLRYSYLNKWNKGIVRGVNGIAGWSGQGKAQPLYSKLYSENGEITMGDAKVGMKIYCEDGKLHTITGVYPQGKKQVVRVWLSDGSYTDCCEEHLWGVKKLSSKPRDRKNYKLTPEEIENNWRIDTITTKDLYNIGIKKIKYFNKDKRYIDVAQYHIPITKPVEFKEKTHIISPYLLGALIGDGYLSEKQTICFSNTEIDILDKVKCLSEQIDNVKFYKNEATQCQFNIINSKFLHGKNNKFKTALRDLDLLGKKSYNKFIPDEYKYDCVENRLELLRGLFDTDGNVNGARTHIHTVSKQLAKDIVWLCQSLGMTASISEDIRPEKYKYSEGICYKVTIQFLKGFEPFSSEKHRSKYTEPIRYKYVRRHIEKIEYLNEYTEMQCIMVDNPTHLYLTDNFIVTHNTTLMVTVYLLSLLENSKDKICIFCNEQVYETIIQTLTFAYITNVLVFLNQNAKTISRAEYGENCLSKEDMDYFVNAMLHWKERYKDRITHIYFETMQPSILRREIKKKVRQGFRHFVYDTFKADEEEYKDIIELSKVADNLTKRFNITFTITLQMSGESYGTKYLTYKCLARAKAIKEILENLIMFRKLDKEELVNLIVMKHNEETGKDEEVSFRTDVPYYAFFCDKNRNGRDGYVLLYYIDLDTLYYEEIGVIQNMPKDTSRKKSS